MSAFYTLLKEKLVSICRYDAVKVIVYKSFSELSQSKLNFSDKNSQGKRFSGELGVVQNVKGECAVKYIYTEQILVAIYLD